MKIVELRQGGSWKFTIRMPEEQYKFRKRLIEHNKRITGEYYG